MGVRVEVAPGLAAVAGNLRYLQQVFVNLVLNAVQATPRRGDRGGGAGRRGLRGPHGAGHGKGIPAEQLPTSSSPLHHQGSGPGTGLAWP
jgi:signal transduction histidine kinase